MTQCINVWAKGKYNMMLGEQGTFDLAFEPIADLVGAVSIASTYVNITLVRRNIKVIRAETIFFNNTQMGRSMLVVEVSHWPRSSLTRSFRPTTTDFRSS